VSSKFSAESIVNVYHGDEIVEQVSRDKAREMKASGNYFFFHHGKDLKRVAVCAPIETEIEQVMGWNIEPWMRHCALNRGRAGQFCLGYDIPYVFEGHLKKPKASEVNAHDSDSQSL
jgi:hypothetical protein